MPRSLGGGAPSAPPAIPSPTLPPQPPIIVLPSGGCYGENNSPTTHQLTASETRSPNLSTHTNKSSPNQGSHGQCNSI